MSHRHSCIVMLMAGLLSTAALSAQTVSRDTAVMAMAKQKGQAPVLLVLPDQHTPSLVPLQDESDPKARRRTLVQRLQARAEAQQRDLRAWLDDCQIPYRAYWITNAIAALLTESQLQELSERNDLARLALDAPIPNTLPKPESALSKQIHALPWGLEKINAPQVWTQGIRGQGVVVAGADTGYQWDHPALKAQYRGWDGTTANHNYNWHDAIHATGSVCGADASAPCDDYNHGTHTMGTMVGTIPGGDVIGVAPQARWIGCRNMNAGAGTPSRYIECMQWFMAPTDSAGNNPDPDQAPDIINNSWGCTVGEGCTTGEELRVAVDNLVAGGIFFVVSAGNGGAGCSTIRDAPAIYDSSFVVAASQSDDSLVNFSSRGPVAGNIGVTLDIAAPGVGVYSSIRNNGYQNMSGTSMAGPHVAGVAALMMSANPDLKGRPEQVADLLRNTAERQGITDPYNTGCGGLTLNDWPNWQAGYGRLDAWEAVQRALNLIFLDGFEQSYH